MQFEAAGAGIRLGDGKVVMPVRVSGDGSGRECDGDGTQKSHDKSPWNTTWNSTWNTTGQRENQQHQAGHHSDQRQVEQTLRHDRAGGKKKIRYGSERNRRKACPEECGTI